MVKASCPWLGWPRCRFPQYTLDSHLGTWAPFYFQKCPSLVDKLYSPPSLRYKESNVTWLMQQPELNNAIPDSLTEWLGLATVSQVPGSLFWPGMPYSQFNLHMIRLPENSLSGHQSSTGLWRAPLLARLNLHGSTNRSTVPPLPRTSDKQGMSTRHSSLLATIIKPGNLPRLLEFYSFLPSFLLHQVKRTGSSESYSCFNFNSASERNSFRGERACFSLFWNQSISLN